MDALNREIEEETGINILGLPIKLANNKGRAKAERILDGKKVLVEMSFNTYKITIDKNSTQIKAKPGGDLVRLQWFDAAEISSIKNTPPTILLFKKMGYIK